MRYLNNHYLSKRGISLNTLLATDETASGTSSITKTPRKSPQRQKRVNIPSGDISTDAYLVYSQMTDRAERIKTVLEAKPQATVKDIAEVITDVSEKTIQRELNSLIEKGQVIREGERRWSRYSVAK
jgi:predicted HTH transcriptional regulator